MDSKVVFVTGADRGLGLALTAGLLEQGMRVIAGQFMPDWVELDELASRYSGLLSVVPLNVASEMSAQEAARLTSQMVDRVDVLINNAGVISPTNLRSIRESQDYAEMHRVFDINALGPLRMVEAFLPLVEKSTIRRLCFVSSEAGSIERSTRTSWFGYCMSKSALNMGIKILFNDLRPQGYSFRVYHPGWVRSYMSGHKNSEADLEPEEAARPALGYFLGGIGSETSSIDEDRLVLRDYKGQEWPW
jgi:NAD(P)-dependent dehydrogenase (short-subunit alcohol dehydrogenase family)